MSDVSLSFYRWARLRDFVVDGLSLRRQDIQELIRDGYLEREGERLSVTKKGNEALQHEPSV